MQTNSNRSSLSRTALRLLAFTLVSILPSLASGQGFLIESAVPRPLPRWVVRPIPPRPTEREQTPYSIESEEIGATINGSVAQVDVAQTFKNEGNRTIETAFVFPLPYDGAIDSMTLLVDGKEYPAQLLDSKEAREKYESIVRKNRDPALLEWVGTGLFQTSVFPIPAGESRTISLHYTQLLRSSDGLTEFLFPLSCAKYSAKPVKKIAFDVTIVGDAELKNVYSPSFDVKVERNGKNVAKVTHTLENETPSADFRLFFDQNADELSAKIQSYRPDENEDGYFLLLASPKIVDESKAPLPKTVLFALDVSGSMSGQKILQARDSLKFVISRLRDGDKFNVVLFNSDVTSYKEELQVSSAETRADALAFADSVRARGSTNVEDALKTVFAQIAKDDSSNPKYLVFLSDGAPTVKECNEMKLAQIARENNKSQARFLSLGVGYDVNSRLLDRFVRDGRGIGEYVKPEENVEERVAAVYSHIEAPVFSEVAFNYALKDDAEKKYFVNMVYPSERIDVFAGEQIVVVGRYSTPGEIVIDAQGKVGEKDVQFKFDGKLTSKSEDTSFAFVERIWASRRVGEIIDKLDLDGANKELLDELLQLAKKHGIVTPYTSFLADDSVALNADASNAARATMNFNAMASQTSNASGFAQRSLKQSYRNANSLAASANGANGASMDMAMKTAPSLAMPGAAMSNMGGIGVGMGGGMNASASKSSFSSLSRGRTQRTENAAESRPIDETMKTIASKTFYLKQGEWIDASINEELEKNQRPIIVIQFGDEYFKLVAQFGQEFSQYLVFTEPTTIYFQGKIYKIEPEKK